MCRCSGETVDHLLLHCEIAYAIWTFTFSVFGVQRVLPKSLVELQSEQRNLFENYSSFGWNLAPLCLLQTKTTRHTFEGVDASTIQLRLTFIRTLFEWSYVLGHSEVRAIVDFIISLSFRLKLSLSVSLQEYFAYCCMCEVVLLS